MSNPTGDKVSYPSYLLGPDGNAELQRFRSSLVATCVAIEKGELPRLISLLALTPYEESSDELFDDVLEEYFSRCARIHREKSDRIEIGQQILSRFQSALETRLIETEEEVSLFRYMLLSLSFSEETIAFLRLICPDDTFEERMVDLIDAPETPMTAYAARRLVHHYPEKALEVYMNLFDKAEEKKNEAMIDFLEAKIKECAPPCPKPTYLRKFTHHDGTPLKLPDDSPEGKGDVSIETIASILYERLNTFGLQIKQKDVVSVRCIASIIASSNPLQRKLLLDAIHCTPDNAHPVDIRANREKCQICDGYGTCEACEIKDILPEKTIQHGEPQETRETKESKGGKGEAALIIFRLLGPLNTSPDNIDGPPDCICSYYQGCRMFGCCEFEYDEEDEELVEREGTEDWFTGNCEHCFLVIPNRFWSVRRPLMSGGWKGCYCCWDCVREGIIILALPPQDESILISRTHMMEADMHEIGIADQ